jgi:hypothetical protein
MTNNPQPQDWKTKVYVFGALIGAVFGVFSSYLYARAIEDDVSRVGKAQRIQTGDVLGLGLAALAMARQIAEMGKGPEKTRRR